MTPPAPIEVGKRYRVDLQDCCVEAQFTATVIELEDEGYARGRMLFDNGVRLDYWSAVEFVYVHPYAADPEGSS